jgi:hypothetical protein
VIIRENGAFSFPQLSRGEVSETKKKEFLGIVVLSEE